jgi:hypothetical protein
MQYVGVADMRCVLKAEAAGLVAALGLYNGWVEISQAGLKWPYLG